MAQKLVCWCVDVSILAPDRNAARNGRPAFAKLKRVSIKRFCPQNFPQTNPSVLLINVLRHMRMPGGGTHPLTLVYGEKGIMKLFDLVA